MDDTALEEIRALKYRYVRSIDLKQWDELVDTLTTDATTDYGSPSGGRPLTFTGREDILAYLRENLTTEITTMHQCTNPEITVHGDYATGSWGLTDTVIVPAHQVLITGAAYYSDQYRREQGTWRIAHTGYTRLYEAKMKLTDLPSFRLTANLWAPST